MAPDAIALAAIVILLFPMAYFLLAAPAFLLVKLDIQPVAQLLRGMFNVHFLMMTIAGIIGAVAFAATGRLFVAIAIGLLAAFAVWSRRWFIPRMDAELLAREAGDADAPRRLRRLHLVGILCKAVHLAANVGSIPYFNINFSPT